MGESSQGREWDGPVEEQAAACPDGPSLCVSVTLPGGLLVAPHLGDFNFLSSSFVVMPRQRLLVMLASSQLLR